MKRKETKVTDEEITAIQAELEGAKKEVENLQAQLGERDAKMGELQAVIASQSEAITEKGTLIEAHGQELTTVKAQLEEATTLSEGRGQALTEAVGKYRSSLIASNPEVPEEMIVGETIADIAASLETAKGLVTKVKAKVEEEAKAIPIPAGAPERSGPDLSSMSPREKIEYAIAKETK